MLVCVLVGLSGLYIYVRTTSAVDMQVSDVDASDSGRLVRVEGYAKDVHRYADGHVLLTLTDLKVELGSFLPSNVVPGVDARAFVRGAYVSVAGEVKVFNGMVELTVKAGSDVRLITPAGGKDVPIATVLSVPERFEGMRVSVSGEIVSIKKSTGNLTILATDPQNVSNEIMIVVDKQINETIVYRDTIDVYGEFTYGYEVKEGWRIVVDLPEHGISRGALSNATAPVELGDVLSHPSTYANKSVHIKGLLVEKAQTVSGTGFKLLDEKMSLTCFIYWYEWKRTDVAEHDTVRFSGTVQYYVPQGVWRIASDAPDDLVRL